MAVRAYKQLIGQRRLVDVPTDLYTIQTQTYGSVTAVEIVVHFPLSARKDEGWTDDLYITFQSDIGPDVVEILKHLITHYTHLGWDEESFNHAQEKLQAFPANFPLLEQKNAVQLLQEIAFQARCALWISDGTFYLKYLPEEPTPADTITISDIDADSGIEVELTATEDLVTKMKIKWRLSWTAVSDRPEDTNEQTIILRHNVAKYGLQEQDYDFYIYNQPDIVYKCGDVLDDPQLDHLEADQVQDLPEQAEPGDVRRRDAGLRQPLRGQWPRVGGRGKGQLQFGGQPGGLPMPGAGGRGDDGEVQVLLALGAADHGHLADRRPRSRPARRAAAGSAPTRRATCRWATLRRSRPATWFSSAAPTWCFAARATGATARPRMSASRRRPS